MNNLKFSKNTFITQLFMCNIWIGRKKYSPMETSIHSDPV